MILSNIQKKKKIPPLSKKKNTNQEDPNCVIVIYNSSKYTGGIYNDDLDTYSPSHVNNNVNTGEFEHDDFKNNNIDIGSNINVYPDCNPVDIKVTDINGEYNNDDVVANNNASVRNNKNDYDNVTTTNTRNSPNGEFAVFRSAYRADDGCNDDDDSSINFVDNNDTCNDHGGSLVDENNEFIKGKNSNKDGIDEITEGIDNNKSDYAAIVGSNSNHNDCNDNNDFEIDNPADVIATKKNNEEKIFSDINSCSSNNNISSNTSSKYSSVEADVLVCDNNGNNKNNNTDDNINTLSNYIDGSNITNTVSNSDEDDNIGCNIIILYKVGNNKDRFSMTNNLSQY